MSVMVKCLSLHQPWASAIALGAKRIETRHWSTNYRGPLLIHAAKTRESLDDEDPEEDLRFIGAPAWRPIPGMPGWPDSLMPLGALVAIARLIACLPSEEFEGYSGYVITEPDGRRHDLDLSGGELALGNYAPGRFGWVLADVRPLPVPIPFRGQQNIFPVPAEILPEGYRP